MLEFFGETIFVTLAGFAGGLILGLAARLGRFCTMGSIEDVLYGGSSVRIRMWGLAIGTAIIGSFGLVAAGLFDPGDSFYLAIRWNPWASVLGGLVFGYGMALSGNCGYGSIARLGGGDLRAFVIVLVMGVSAYVVLSGPLAGLRIMIFPQHDLIAGDEALPGIAHRLSSALGLNLPLVGIAIGTVIATAALASRPLLSRPKSVFWGMAVGAAITLGWAATAYAAREGFAAEPVVSHSFSAPVGETLMWFMTASAQMPSFAVGSVTGVWAGAFAGSLIKGHFRWEACEDPRELRRQILGAALMGGGAVVAMGCTVGQGLSAFSVLSFSAPVTFAAIFVGAALGLRQLIEGFHPAE